MGDAGRGVLPDRLQHRAHALHGGHRRAGGDGLHAHAARQDLLGLVLRGAVFPADRLARVGGHRGRCDFLPVRGPAGSAACGRDGHLPDRHRHLSRLRRSAADRQAHRAHAGGAQLGAGGLHPRQLPGARNHLRPRRHVVLRAGGFHGLRYGARHASISCRSTSTSCLLGALVGYSGGGGVLNLTLSNWARDKGYGMGSRVGHIAGRRGR